MPHATGTHHTALRLACGGEYPRPGSHPFAGLQIVDLACGPHPFPHVPHGPSFLDSVRTRVTVDLPGAPPPEIPEMGQRRIHNECDLNGIDMQSPLMGVHGWGSVDLVVALEILEHVENPWRLLRMIGRLLKTGGVAVVSTPDITNQVSREFFLREGTFPWFGEADIDGQGHISPILPHMLRAMAERAGMTITDEAHNEPPPSTPQAEADFIRDTIRVVRMEKTR